MKNNNCNNPPSIYYYTHDSEYDLDIPYGIVYRQATVSRLFSSRRAAGGSGSSPTMNYPSPSRQVRRSEAKPSKPKRTLSIIISTRTYVPQYFHIFMVLFCVSLFFSGIGAGMAWRLSFKLFILLFFPVQFLFFVFFFCRESFGSLSLSLFLHLVLSILSGHFIFSHIIHFGLGRLYYMI